MTDTADVAVQKALLERLKALTFSPAITVAYPNIVFTPPTPAFGTQWLRANFLPAPKIALGIDDGAMNQISGILQVDALMYPGAGELPVARLAQAVTSWFARGTELTQDSQRVRIVRTPYRGRLIADDPWVFIPVSIPYLAFSDNPL